MGAIANIVLNDGQTTPVAKTFAVRRVGDVGGEGNLAEWEDRSSTYYIGYNRIVLETSFPKASRPDTIRMRIRVTTPKMENVTNSTVSGVAPAPRVSYTPMFDGTFVIPTRSSLQDRKDLLAYVRNLLANAQVIAAAEQLDVPF